MFLVLPDTVAIVVAFFQEIKLLLLSCCYFSNELCLLSRNLVGKRVTQIVLYHHKEADVELCSSMASESGIGLISTPRNVATSIYPFSEPASQAETGTWVLDGRSEGYG